MKRFVYWFLQLTWGVVMTLPGLIGLLFMKISKRGKIYKNGYSYIVELNGNWGGVNLGAISFCGNYSETYPEWFEDVRKHEYGHSIQNIIFGPFHLFLVAIPSFIRYWYQEIRSRKGLKNKPYDSIWFEGMATKVGTKVINKIEGAKHESL